MKKQSIVERIYRNLYRKIKFLFMFKYAHLIIIGIIIFELFSPVKLIYTVHGVTLTFLSAYFLSHGLGQMLRAIVPSITNMRYLMKG